jgi:hypothetical protein
VFQGVATAGIVVSGQSSSAPRTLTS